MRFTVALILLAAALGVWNLVAAHGLDGRSLLAALLLVWAGHRLAKSAPDVR